MSAFPSGLVEALQHGGAPVCDSIARQEDRCALLVLGQRDSFLDVLARCCAAGASGRVTIWSPDRDLPEAGGSARVFAETDGLTLPDADSALAPGAPTLARFARTVDRVGLAFGRVAVLALDAEALAAGALAGAKQLIARDRPTILAHPGAGGAARLEELEGQGYVLDRVIGWSYPRAAPILIVARPGELAAAMGRRLIAPPRLSCECDGAPDGPPAIAATIGAEALVAQSGVYPAQRARGGHLVWTGPHRQSDLLLPQLWHGSVRIGLRIVRTFAGEGLAGLSAQLNGRAVTTRVEGDSLVVNAHVAPQEFSGALRLSLVTPQLRGPDELDPRLRGTAISAVDVDWTGGR